MSEENTAKIKGGDVSSNEVPRKYKFLNSFIIFLLASWIFSVALFDISGYIEDHGFNYGGAEFFVLFILLIIFYGSEYLYDRFVPQEIRDKTDDSKAQLLFSSIIASIFIILFCFFVIPGIAQSGAEETKIFEYTVAIWLASILILNILFNSNRFQELIPAIIKKIRRNDNG
jgi:hypothetical protein